MVNSLEYKTEVNHLILFREIITICSVICMAHINLLRQNMEFIMLELMFHTLSPVP